jgi:protein-tyrosine phosphatase
MAVGLLRHHLTERGIDDVAVSSAGFMADDRPATEDAVFVLGRQGIDLTAHRSRVLTPEMLDDADLVIGMARLHVREGTVLRRPAFPRMFTLKELVRRGEETGARKDGETVEDWVARVGQGREPRDFLGDARDDDVADPVGRSTRIYKKTAKELDDLVVRLVALLWPEGEAEA